MAHAQVTGLFIYPVKGLGGISLQQSALLATGLEGDRQWMLVMPNGRMVTQRQLPLMSLISTRLSGDRLVISRENEADLIINLSRVPDRQVPVSVWSDSFTALDEGELASAWFTRVLSSKFPLRLVRMDNRVLRPQSRPELLGQDTSTGFADAAPYLLASESSLQAVNARLASRGADVVPMNRFRPNLVIRGLPAFEEYKQGYLSMKSDIYSLTSCYPCERCVVTTTNQLTGEIDKIYREPLATLLEMNTVDSQKGAYFGQNMILSKGTRQLIRLGDRLAWHAADLA